MNGSDLLALWAPSLKVTRRDEPDAGPYSVDGVEVWGGESTWCGFPDLMVEGDCLVGVTFLVTPTEARTAEEICLKAHGSLQLISVDSAQERYPGGPPGASYLEFLWKNTPRPVQHLAQLDFSFANWLWESERESESELPCGVVIYRVDELGFKTLDG